MAVYTVYFANDDGTPATGLTVTFSTMKLVSDNTDIGSPPAITEIGGGHYKFTYTPAAKVVATIDGSATITTGRYVPAVLTPNDEDIALVGSRATQTSVDTVDTVVDAIKLKTDNLPADPASQSGQNFPANIDTIPASTALDLLYSIIVGDTFVNTANGTVSFLNTNNSVVATYTYDQNLSRTRS